jgi:sulfate adenylyltransferase subunit 1 (EFTu-like GTPase family)
VTDLRLLEPPPLAREAKPGAALDTRRNDVLRHTTAQRVFADRYAGIRATGGFVLIDEATNNTVAAGLLA